MAPGSAASADAACCAALRQHAKIKKINTAILNPLRSARGGGGGGPLLTHGSQLGALEPCGGEPLSVLSELGARRLLDRAFPALPAGTHPLARLELARPNAPRHLARALAFPLPLPTPRRAAAAVSTMPRAPGPGAWARDPSRARSPRHAAGRGRGQQRGRFWSRPLSLSLSLSLSRSRSLSLLHRHAPSLFLVRICITSCAS